jgi:hypothetical protein
MSGILSIGIVVIWFLIVIAIASRVGSGISDRWRWLFKTAVFCGALVLPVADEIVGGFQFRALCKANASEFRLGVKNPEGRTTKLTINPSNHYLPGKAISIRHSHFEYHDVATGELVVAHDRYVAEGGRLARAIGAGSTPITIVDNSSCSPERDESVNRTLKFNVIN